MAEALAACGAKVAILALGQEGCDAKAEQIKAAGGTAIGINFSFWAVMKNPGAIAFTLIPTFDIWTASHWVKLVTAAFAPEYAGIY